MNTSKEDFMMQFFVNELMGRGFKYTIGGSGKDMTEHYFIDAIAVLESTGAPKPFIAILHPIQIHDLRVALADKTGAVWSAPSERGEIEGAFASLFDVDMYKSTSCPSVNNDEDRMGMLLSRDSWLEPYPKGIALVTDHE